VDCLGVAGRRLAGAISASAVVGFSLSPYVVQWDTSVLSESISLSALAVIFASGIWLAQRFTWMRQPASSSQLRRSPLLETRES